MRLIMDADDYTTMSTNDTYWTESKHDPDIITHGVIDLGDKLFLFAQSNDKITKKNINDIFKLEFLTLPLNGRFDICYYTNNLIDEFNRNIKFKFSLESNTNVHLDGTYDEPILTLIYKPSVFESQEIIIPNEFIKTKLILIFKKNNNKMYILCSNDENEIDRSFYKLGEFEIACKPSKSLNILLDTNFNGVIIKI